ncbi:hypothetical protein G0U57_002152, partial [Chelydra serpentina]
GRCRSCTGTCWPGGRARSYAARGAEGDVFSCSLRILPPRGGGGADPALHLRELPLEPNGAAHYVLPAMLCPRYTPHSETHRSPTLLHVPHSG